jgi:hypothetical protein
MITIDLHHFSKKFILDSKVNRQYLKTKLIQGYTNRYNEMFSQETLVSLNIRLYDQEKRYSKFTNHLEFSDSATDLVSFVEFIRDTLVNVAYYKVSQVANIGIAKLIGSRKKIEIEVTEL